MAAPSSVGGLESVVRALAAGQRRRGHRVAAMAVVSAVGTADGLLSPLRDAGVEVYEAALPGRGYLRERAFLRRVCHEIRPDVVHTHGYRPDVVDSGIGRQQGAAVVTTVHGFTGGDWRNRLYERLQRRMFRRFDAVVAVSRPLAERLSQGGVPQDRVHCVPNAWMAGAAPLDRIAARRLLGVPEQGTLIGWVGRVNRPKGPDVLLDAVPRMTDRTACIVMLGDGPDRTALRARAAELGVADRIFWPGMVRDAAKLFAAFDLFVLSSRTEGTPIVLFEAMSAGVPIVATAVGGVPDVVGPDGALLVPAEDPAALAAAIDLVLHDPVGASLRTRAARRRLEREFAPDPWLARYDEVYLEARKVASRPAARSS